MQKRQARLQLNRTTLRHLDPADPLRQVRGGIDTSCGEACTCACNEEVGEQVEKLPAGSFNIICTC